MFSNSQCRERLLLAVEAEHEVRKSKTPKVWWNRSSNNYLVWSLINTIQLFHNNQQGHTSVLKYCCLIKLKPQNSPKCNRTFVKNSKKRGEKEKSTNICIKKLCSKIVLKTMHCLINYDVCEINLWWWHL